MKKMYFVLILLSSLFVGAYAKSNSPMQVPLSAVVYKADVNQAQKEIISFRYCL